jgi:hypothetical protein
MLGGTIAAATFINARKLVTSTAEEDALAMRCGFVVLITCMHARFGGIREDGQRSFLFANLRIVFSALGQIMLRTVFRYVVSADQQKVSMAHRSFALLCMPMKRSTLFAVLQTCPLVILFDLLVWERGWFSLGTMLVCLMFQLRKCLAE